MLVNNELVSAAICEINKRHDLLKYKGKGLMVVNAGTFSVQDGQIEAAMNGSALPKESISISVDVYDTSDLRGETYDYLLSQVRREGFSEGSILNGDKVTCKWNYNLKGVEVSFSLSIEVPKDDIHLLSAIGVCHTDLYPMRSYVCSI